MQLAKKIILGVVALILVLWIGAYVAVQIAFPPEKIKSMVSAQASKALNRQVTIGDASVGVFPDLKIALTDLRVANSPGFSPDPAIGLKEMGFSIGVLSLLKFSPVINEIRLVEPEFLYEIDAMGRNNLEGLLGAKDTAQAESTGEVESPVAVALKAFVIEDGRVRYRNLKDGQEIVLDKIHQRASLDLDQKLADVNSAGELEIRQIRISDRNSGLRKGDISIRIAHQVHLDLPGEELLVRNLEMTFQDVTAKLEGEARNFSTGPTRLDLRFDAPDIKLASVIREIPAGVHPEIGNITASGAARLQGWVKGKMDTASLPSMQISFNLKDGALSHKELGEGIRNLHIRAVATQDTFDLSDFGFELADNPATMTALLTGLRDEFPMLDHLALHANLDLGKLMPLLAKLGMAPEGMRVEGVVRSEIKANGRLNPQEPAGLDAKGEVRLENILVQDKSLPAPVRANGLISLTDEKITEDLALRVGESDVALQGSISHYLALVLPGKAQGKVPQVRAMVMSENLNLDELLGKKEQKEVKDGPPMRSFPSLPDLDAVVEVKLARTQFLEMAMTDFTATAKLDKQVADTDLRGRLYTGGFSSRMRFDLRDTTDAKVDLSLNVDKVEANDFLSRLNDKIPRGNRLAKTLARMDSTVFGKFTLNADLATHGLPQTFADNLTGRIHSLLSDGRIAETGLVASLSGALAKVHESLGFGEMTFSRFESTLEAAQGRLIVKNANLRGTPVGDIETEGSIGFDNTVSLTLANYLPPAISRKVTGATGALATQVAQLSGVQALANVRVIPEDKQGRAILYYQVGGTLASPSFALNANRMAEEAGGGVKSQLADEARRKADELKARAEAEKQKLENQAKARAEEERAKLEKKAEEEKGKVADEAKKKGKKILKGLGL